MGSEGVPALSKNRSLASVAAAILSRPGVTAILALALVIGLGLVFHGRGAFYKWDAHRDALRLISVYAILACGMTIVILSAGIDLSVGSVLGLIAVAFAILVVRWEWSAWAAIPACLLLVLTIVSVVLCHLVPQPRATVIVGESASEGRFAPRPQRLGLDLSAGRRYVP